LSEENYPMSLAQSHFEKLLAGVLPKSLSLVISVLLLSTLWASAADPLGATPHSDGSTTFRVWAPFVDAVAVKINGGTAVPLAKEDGHPDPADTTWVGTVSGAKAGDKYRYAIQRGGATREFNDPRAQQLTGFDLPDGFGRSKRSARALIICDFKEMDRLPMASGFSAIQNNSGVSQGLSPRLAPQSTTRAVGILMPLWSEASKSRCRRSPV
jgi:hypothetical protein